MIISVKADLPSFYCRHGPIRRALLALGSAMLLGLQAAFGATFVNSTLISINPAGAPPAVTPYPSIITVSNLAGTITDVSVTLSNLSHSFPDDLDILLIGPGGQRVLMMSDSGGDNTTVNPPVTLRFSDSAANPLPDSTRIIPGTYRPWNYAPADTFPAPAPTAPYPTNFSVFDGTNPNGSWRLFVADDVPTIGNGSIAGGWQLHLNVAVSPPVITNQPQDQAVVPGGTATFRVGVTGTPPFGYQWLRNGEVFIPFGQGGPTLTIANVSASDVGVYSVIVNNAASPNGVRSADARLTLIQPVAIVSQPKDQAVLPGGTATFEVEVSGTPPFAYQWLRNGEVIVPFGQGGPTLTIRGVQPAQAGFYAVMVANAASPNGVRSDDARLILLEPVTIISQPKDQAVPPGGTAIFRVDVTGTPPLSFQWLRNGEVIVPFGQGGPSLTIENVTAADVGVYSVIVRNAASPVGVRGDDARLILLEPVVIVRQPEDQTVLPGGTATFRVEVTGTPPFLFQWLRNGRVILPFGEGGPELTLVNVQADQAGFFAVMVANAASPNGVRSDEANLNVLGPLIIVEPPPSVIVQPGVDVRLRVTAAGRPPIRFQWTLNGMVLTNETNATLTLPKVDAKSGGNYQVVIWNEREAVTTQPAFVLVRGATGPSPADKFADRPSTESLQGVLQGNNSQARTEPGEPVLRGGGRSVWFEWQALDNGIVTLAARGSTFDTLLAVYTGTKVEDLTPVTKDDDRGGFYTSSLKFNAIRGTRYQIQLDGFGLDGAGGEFTVCWELERTEDLIPIILEEPASVGVHPGGTAAFRVITDGQPVQYQWFFNGRAIPGATDNVLTIRNAKSAHVGLYAVQIMNRSQRMLFSETVNLQLGSFTLPEAQDKLEEVYFALAGRSSGGGGFQAAAGGSLGAGYMAIGLGNLVSNEFTSVANHQSFDPNPCGGAFLGTLWQGLFTTNSGPVQINTFGSEIPARLGIYHVTGGLSDLTAPPIVCDLTSASNGLPVVVQFDAQQGSNYLVVVEGFQATGNIELNCLMGLAPPLNNPLRYCFVPPGGSIQLSMPATNWFPTPACQWFSNSVAIPGATGQTLLVSDFSEGKVGTYSVSMSNFVGTATRNVAYLALAGPFILNHWWVTNVSGVGFVLNASNGTPFVLETTTSLNSSWLPIATNPDPCLILLYTNLGALTEPQRFFRATPWPPIGP